MNYGGVHLFNKNCPEEYPITLYLNSHELLTIQLTEVHLEDWTVGYLYAEGIIDSPDEIKEIQVNPYRGNISVEVAEHFDLEAFLKRRRTITAGCGRGVTFRSLKEVGNFKKLHTARSVSLQYLQQKMREFSKLTPLYHKTGGMHAACIIDQKGEMIVREDIGRHNAVDKVIGAALQQGLEGKDVVILTTGRISFEMCSKVARFGVGVAGSRTAATNLAVALGKELHVDLVGYVRGKSAFVYTHGKHITKEESSSL